MKRYVSLFLLALMFCAVVSIGCGGSSDPEQSESLTDDTGSYDPNDEARGNSEEPTDLSTLTADYIAHDGETLTGTLGANVKVSIADGAAVTIIDVTISGDNSRSYDWAGLTCLGDATINLKGSNYIKCFYENCPGISVPPKGYTLTITGTGSLDASSTGYGAGIGGGLRMSCGNIKIEGGTITATGGSGAAGIGCGQQGKCGNITITGGTLIAIGGWHGAGIGGGFYTKCGNITITGGTGTAMKGKEAQHSIGLGKGGSVETVTINGVEGAVSENITYSNTGTSPFTSIDLSIVKSSLTVKDGQTLTGKLGANVEISIADGATITLKDATIEGVNDELYDWAGLTCEGDATLIIEGFNSVKGFYAEYPGLYVPRGHTLTIKGDGLLNATSNGNAAGIGAGYHLSCGNIVLEGGTIYATGGTWAAGIGGGDHGYCGHITIADTVRKVTAIKGSSAPYAIGTGSSYSSGVVSICGKVVESRLSIYTYLGSGSDGLGTIDLNIVGPTKWYTLSANSAFYGKTMAGIWERLVNNINKNGKYYSQISKEYVAFGFEVNEQVASTWPYSGVFWTADGSSRPDKINITLGGDHNSNTSVEIKVDDKQVFYEYHCSNKPRYDWQGNGRAIHVTTYKTGSYRTNENTQHLYARKPGGKWTIVFDGGITKDYDFYIDGDYVEFGFEFDITWGRDWPYSHPFWFISDSEKEKVNEIYIEMNGTSIYYPALYIDVNGRRVVNKDYLYDDKQYKWSEDPRL